VLWSSCYSVSQFVYRVNISSDTGIDT